MPILTKILLYAVAGALGGSAAWAFVITLSVSSTAGLLTEVMLGGIAGLFIGAFLWSHEAIAGRQVAVALKRAGYGAVAGLIGGAAGAALGSTVFTYFGRLAADAGGFKASLGVALAVALGWSILGAAAGLSGGLMIRSRERALYGISGGALGGLFGGLLFNQLSVTSIWSVLAGLMLLGALIGALISVVEEAFVSAKVKVIKGRHIGREFPLLKDTNSVGRDDRSDVCLSGAEGVGIRHAFIKKKNGHFSIETDEAGKPMYVNQKLLRSSKLTDGDVIRVGSVLLLFSAVKKAATLVAFLFVLGCILGHEGVALAVEPTSVHISQFDLIAFPEVKTYVSVLDTEGKPVRGLTKENVLLSENGQPVAIDTMQMYGMNGKQEPFSLSIVVDRSGSMAGDKIMRAKESVTRFLSLMEPDDRAALITFSDRVERLVSLTDNIGQLKQATDAIKAGGHTALFDAIAAGVENVQGIPGRRAVIVLTDGIANRGALDINEAIAAAVKQYVSIYVIGLGSDVRTARLERIAEETGGFYFFTPSSDGLSQIYDTISRRIRGEYIITYHTEMRADYLRNVALTLSTGQKAGRSYFQPESSLFGEGSQPAGWAFGISLASVLGLLAISLRRMDQHYQTGHLSLVRGRGTQKDIDISSSVTIGNHERNTLGLFKDSSIAEQHAEVRKEHDRYIIEDKGSSTGTFVNRKKVTGRQMLEDGDVINVGQATIVFSEEQGRHCAGCGGPIHAGAKYCVTCGAKAA